MSENLSEEQKIECKTVFDLFDDDKDGAIPVEDFPDVIRSLGCNLGNEEIKQLVKEMDRDRSKKIEYEEFEECFGNNFENQISESELKESFALFDKDGNGFISRDELMRVMTTLGETLTKEEAQEIVDQADIDKDGQIDYHEFTLMMTNQ